MAIFLTITYNNVPFTNFIRDNFYIFAIAAFVFLTVLMLVHTALDYVRRPPQCYICYLTFTVSECWVVAFFLARTDGATVFLFAATLTSMVLAISIFLNTKTLTWTRGLISLLLMASLMFVITYMTLNYTDIITIIICIVGGLLFGCFLLSKTFALLHSRYSHALSRDDYVIGCLTLYVDFGFVLLIMLFIMLAMIKSFTS